MCTVFGLCGPSRPKLQAPPGSGCGCQQVRLFWEKGGGYGDTWRWWNGLQLPNVNDLFLFLSRLHHLFRVSVHACDNCFSPLHPGLMVLSLGSHSLKRTVAPDVCCAKSCWVAWLTQLREIITMVVSCVKCGPKPLSSKPRLGSLRERDYRVKCRQQEALEHRPQGSWSV